MLALSILSIILCLKPILEINEEKSILRLVSEAERAFVVVASTSIDLEFVEVASDELDDSCCHLLENGHTLLSA